MRVRILFILFLISVLLNVTLVWHYVTAYQLLNKDDLISRFEILKSDVTGTRENLYNALNEENDAKTMFINLYRANRRLESANNGITYLVPIINSTYFTDISLLEEHLVKIQHQLNYIQENIINNDFESIDEKEYRNLEILFEEVDRLNDLIKDKSFSFSDFENLKMELIKER